MELGFDYGYALVKSKYVNNLGSNWISVMEPKLWLTNTFHVGRMWNNQNGIVLLLPHGYEGQGRALFRKNGAIYNFVQDKICL
jgi:2-oxoglutarate dehydrogenase E1 component